MQALWLKIKQHATVDNTILLLVLIALAVFARFLPFYVTAIFNIAIFALALLELRKGNDATAKLIFIFYFVLTVISIIKLLVA